MGNLSYSDKTNVMQVMPLKKGLVNLVAGTFKAKLIYCVTDGNVTITWRDNTTTVVAMVEGNTFTLQGIKNVILNTPASSGKFHLA